jgi:pantothenate kinase-related protein Tda10
MQATVADCAQELLMKHAVAPSSRRLLCGVTGIPGSGKSVFAQAVCEEVNARAGSEIATVLSMDGWHYTRAKVSWLGKHSSSRELTSLTIRS